MYYGDVALSTKPVMLIWTLLIPATRGHVIQSKVLAMITDYDFFLMIACLRFETEFHFEYTSYYRKYLMLNSIITTANI